MDHYRTLGLSRSATKEEIKDAFRRAALKFHPDRHSHSSKEAREGASAKFRQASEAYEVLIDDRTRADYDLRTRVQRPSSSSSYTSSYASSSSSSYSSKSSPSSGNSYYGAPPRPRDGFEFEFEFRYRAGRASFMNILLVSALLVGASLMERAVEGIWKRNNSGKSFEDLMESIEKDKVQKENRGDS